jgi:hypothetical protein
VLFRLRLATTSFETVLTKPFNDTSMFLTLCIQQKGLESCTAVRHTHRLHTVGLSASRSEHINDAEAQDNHAQEAKHR